jgi:hypothetical protein
MRMQRQRSPRDSKMAYGVRKDSVDRLSREILSYCKGNCSPVDNKRNDDTSRGSEGV